MTDAECVRFLQWALPRLGYRWQGFRNVRRQVRRRLAHRMDQLALADLDGYRAHLEASPAEWPHLDAACRITISRFCRDRATWDALRHRVLPELHALAIRRCDCELRAWSAGCASGEEAYTLRIAWSQWTDARLGLCVLGTDIDDAVLARARLARYAEGTLRELPDAWRTAAFTEADGELRLDEALRDVVFQRHDVRADPPAGPFHLVLCRNLVLTYLDEERQRSTLGNMLRSLVPGGALVIGGRERLPAGLCGLEAWNEKAGIFRRV